MNNSVERPFVSIIIPAYNEEALLAANLSVLHEYLRSPERNFDWELLVINDGSDDATGSIADEFARANSNVRVLHHPSNFGLGQALKFGFANTSGDYVISMDVDLSYDTAHIDELLTTIRQSNAKIVLASPYMRGGSIENVPRVRKVLSILGNRFLRLFVKGHFSTLTSLVRVYDGPFIRSLDLRSMGMDVMPETVYKAMVLRARIDEMPARLDWGPQLEHGSARASSMRLVRHVFSTILSGFVFRPFLFFVAPGVAIGVFSLYVNFWMFVHFFDALRELNEAGAAYSFSTAFAVAYKDNPHTFIIGFLSAMLSIQLVGMGLIALQSKTYFEDLFHLGSTRLRAIKQRVD
jgi:glycosyltransferase involved in cell wall biosynthesis